MTHSKAKRERSESIKEEKRELCFFFLRLSERLFVFCLFSFFCVSKRFFLHNFYTRALSSTSVIRNTQITRRAREESSTRLHTHTQRKVRPRTPSRVRFRVVFLPVFILFPEEREERFDFDRKDEASFRLWQPPSLRFEFCGSLSSIEKFLIHTFFSLTRAKETASAEEREKEEEERKSRAPACSVRLRRISFFYFLSYFFKERSCCACSVTFLLISSLPLSQKRQVYGKWTKSSNKREQNNFFVD